VLPSHVLVGTQRLELWVPPIYQACVFPAFLTFVAVLGLELRARRATAEVAPKIALVGTTALLALVRLEGRLPLSGHALFLSAALSYELATGRRSQETWPWTTIGIVITGYFKLFVWHDALWFAWSCAVGTLLGGGCALAARNARRA
jgi:hypothetical protein